MSVCLPEDRTRSLLAAFGWQGGTIHQLAEATGIDSTVLLYGEPPHTASLRDYQQGFHWGRSGHPLPEPLQRSYRGNLSFWLGVAQSTYLPDAALTPEPMRTNP